MDTDMDTISSLIQECKAHDCKPGCEHLRELVLCTGPGALGQVVREYLCTASEEIVEDLSWNLLQTGLHLSDGDDGDPSGLEAFRALVNTLCRKCDPTPLFFSLAEAFSDPSVSTEKKGLLLSAIPQMLGRVRNEKRRQSHLASCLGFVRTVFEQCREEASNENKNDDDEEEEGEEEKDDDDDDSFHTMEYGDIAGGNKSGLNESVLDGTVAFIKGLFEMEPTTTANDGSTDDLIMSIAAVSTSALLEAVCEAADGFGGDAVKSVVATLKERAGCGVEYVLTLIMEAKRARVREERVSAFKKRFSPDDYDDYDENDDNDEDDDDDNMDSSSSPHKLSEVGLGAWLHKIVFGLGPQGGEETFEVKSEEERFPGAADRVWAYKAVLTVAVPMLEAPCITANLMAWDLLRAAVASVRMWWGLDCAAGPALRPAARRGLAPRDFDAAALATLARAMLGNVVHLSDTAAREQGTALLQGFWGTLRPALRFDVLGRLLDAISVELVPHVVRQIKREIVHAWPNSSAKDRSRDGGSDADDADPESRKEAEACFCGSRVVELFQRMMNAKGRVFGQLRDRFAVCSDAALDVLNLYRFVLLRDRDTNYTGLLNKSQIGEANRVSLNPVRAVVQECIREYGGYCNDVGIAKRKIESFAMFGLPKISLRDFQDAASRHLLKAYLIEDTLKRIEEITSSLD